MSFYVIPAMLALFVKLFVLVAAYNSKTTTVFYGMILVFALHNLTEVAAYLQFFDGVYSEYLLRSYYAIMSCMIGYMCLYAIEVSGLPALKRVEIVVFAWMALSVPVLVATDLIVAGVAPIGYAITAVQGEFYWIFSGTAFISFVFMISSLVLGYNRTREHIRQVQCLYALLAMAPLILLGFGLVALLSIDIQVNAAGILPIATTLFILITLKSESRTGLTDIRRHVPFSLEHRTSSDIMDIFSRYAKDEANYRDSMAEIEKLLVMHKHQKNDRNVTTTASNMDIPRSSLYSIFRRLKIEHSETS